MTALFSVAPSYCARFGVAVLLVGLADFFFYGQPAGITVFLFAILIAAAVVAVHPTAFSDGRLWIKPAALLVALLPLAENVSALSMSIALAALIVFVLSLSGRLRHRIARIAGQIALFCWRRRSASPAISSAGARRRAGSVGAASGWRRSPSGSCR